MSAMPTDSDSSSVNSSRNLNENCAEIKFGGEIYCLLPERAVFWPAANSLFIADLHVGKEASFRAAGLPVPDIFDRDLARLTRLLERLTPQHLFILGDLLHDRSAHTSEVVGVFSSWRSKHPHLDISLIRGNHDRRAGDPPAEWQIRCSSEPARFGDVQLRHIPRFDDLCLTLAGHLHPKHCLRHGPDQLRLPCFLKRCNTLVLPAFANFIDHAVFDREANDAIFVIADQEVFRI
jgi:DNA ligase-associated metallophosphoesterase